MTSDEILLLICIVFDSSRRQSSSPRLVEMFALIEQATACALVTTVGVLYPAYESFKCLRTKKDARPLLMYW